MSLLPPVGFDERTVLPQSKLEIDIRQEPR